MADLLPASATPAPATNSSSTPATPPTRRVQSTTLVLFLAIAGLIGWRWYSDRYGVQPTELQRDPTHLVDLNRASRSELMQIPGVSAVTAERIVSFRQEKGHINRVEELDAVHGIGPATLNKLRPWVTVEPGDEPIPKEPDRLSRKPTPSQPKGTPGRIDLNTATIDQLDGLPGIGPVLAQRIIAERDKRPFTKVEDLRRVSGIGPKKFEAIKDLVTVGN